MSAAFGGELGWGRRPALLVIDMMRAYFTAGSPFDLGSRTAVDGCAALLAAARDAGLLVVHTRVRYTAGLADGGLFVRKVPGLAVLAEGAGELGRFVPGLEPRPGEVVVAKQYASAFFGTSLAATLTAAGVDTTVIAGVSTSGCVRASATDAMQHGFRPIVAADACGDRDPAVHDANLYDLAAKYADVTTVAAVCAHLAAGPLSPPD
ncbi:isochorismatase family protein [Actinoplanes sp. NPDC048967]|uniref:isochorismatase family protein n=1 Tax=Actinoplanes sp. NPDC048967 TaxID=3155269 RepID=UPI003411D8F5